MNASVITVTVIQLHFACGDWCTVTVICNSIVQEGGPISIAVLTTRAPSQ
jgi:hypothetical protein